MVGLPEEFRPKPGGPLWRAPLIPLPAALLYPGRRLPMHLRGAHLGRLLGEVQAGTGLVAVATMLPGAASLESLGAPVFDVVGVGRVVDSLPFPEGAHVTFEGICRARLVGEERQNGYRVGLVAPLDEQGTETEIEQELANLLKEVGDLGPLARRSGTGLSPGGLADLINVHLPHPVRVKQEIFEILDVALRIRQVRRLLRDIRRTRGFLSA